MSRRLHITTLHRAGGSLSRPRWSRVPQIRLSGHWLQRAGFTAGDRVHVELRDGVLLITPLP